MIAYKEVSWWYWAAISTLQFVGLAGWFEAFYLTIALSVAQLIHYLVRERSFTAFPVQVRVAFLGIVLLCLWGPNWLFWAPAFGTLGTYLLGYCFLARTVSLLPWNLREPMSWKAVRRVYFTPPQKGNIMQGLPATAKV